MPVQEQELWLHHRCSRRRHSYLRRVALYFLFSHSGVSPKPKSGIASEPIVVAPTVVDWSCKGASETKPDDPCFSVRPFVVVRAQTEVVKFLANVRESGPLATSHRLAPAPGCSATPLRRPKVVDASGTSDTLGPSDANRTSDALGRSDAVARVILSAQATPVARVILSAQATPASPAKTSFRERASPKVAGSPLIGHRHKRLGMVRKLYSAEHPVVAIAMPCEQWLRPGSAHLGHWWRNVHRRENLLCVRLQHREIRPRAVQGVSDWRASGLLAWHFRWADGANNGRPNAMPRPRDRSAADLFTPVGRRRFVARRQDSETSTRPSSLPHSAQREFLDRPVAVYRAGHETAIRCRRPGCCLRSL